MPHYKKNQLFLPSTEHGLLNERGIIQRSFFFSLLLDGLRRLGQALDLEPLRGLEEGGQLVLGHVDLAGVHELQDGGEVLDGHVLQDDDGVLGGVLLKQGLLKGNNSKFNLT